MRVALAAVLLAGCLIDPSTGDDYPPPDNTGWGSGYGGGGGTSSWGCQSDAACGTGFVCARNGDCTTASAVHVIHVNWTLKGAPASDASCKNSPQLDITFRDGYGDTFGFSPVPCNAGRYTIDKMPLRFNSVELARAGDYGGGDTGTFDDTGNAALDLPY